MEQNRNYNKDLLNRDVFLEKLEVKINEVSIEGGAIAVHAAFGMGKTFFVENIMVKKYNGYNKKHHLINAALNQHVQTPLNALLCELNSAIGKKAGKLFSKFLKATEFSVGGSIKTNVANVQATANIKMDKLLASTPSEKVAKLKKGLKDLIGAEPLTIIVDELDRCNPKFAIEFIECLQHFFKIPGLVFVLMVNYDQIKKDLIHLYGGTDNDAEKYLEKFFYCAPLELPKDTAFFSMLYGEMLKGPRHKDNYLNISPDERKIDSLSFYSFYINANYRQCNEILETFSLFFSRLLVINNSGNDYYIARSIGVFNYCHISILAVLCVLIHDFKNESGENLLQELKKILQRICKKEEFADMPSQAPFCEYTHSVLEKISMRYSNEKDNNEKIEGFYLQALENILKRIVIGD